MGMKEDIVVEVCPHCGTEVEMRWDVKADGYKAFCPYCGMRLMLCDACQHPDGEYNGGTCDYCSSTDRCKHNDIGWIGVGDKYPPDQEEVLVCTRAKKRRGACDHGSVDEPCADVIRR